MSDLNLFLKKNKKIRLNSFYPATESIIDPETGKPALWEIRPIPTEEAERIREECTHSVLIPGKRNMYRDKIDVAEYLDKLTVAAVVYPDLLNAELQDSYDVSDPVDLLKQMIDNPAEYTDLQTYVQEQSGFTTEISDEVKEAKN